jgi:hypothetical protein
MLATLVLAVTACAWAHPGASRFTGTDAAVNDYKDIPAPVRAALRGRMQRHAYDDVATITRDRIFGSAEYGNLRAMHFGSRGRVCQTVTRPWKPEHQEQGLVYCEGEHCIIVPSVCGNIARVSRRTPAVARAAPAAGGPGGGVESAGGTAPPPVVTLQKPIDFEDMPPTGAGIRPPDPGTSFAQGSTPSAGRVEPAAFSGNGIPIMWPGGGAIGGGLLTPAVPEPAIWASLLVGFCGLAAALRRRAPRH